MPAPSPDPHPDPAVLARMAEVAARPETAELLLTIFETGDARPSPGVSTPKGDAGPPPTTPPTRRPPRRAKRSRSRSAGHDEGAEAERRATDRAEHVEAAAVRFYLDRPDAELPDDIEARAAVLVDAGYLDGAEP